MPENKFVSHIWLTKDNKSIPMMEMEDEHLHKAFTHATSKLYHAHVTGSKFYELIEQLEEVAAERGITLKYVDEVYPSEKWGNFFNNMRKTKKMISEEEKAILATTTEDGASHDETVVVDSTLNEKVE